MNLSEHPYLLSILLGIVEGLTEFLPVSSTAHLRIIKPWVGISLQDPYWKMYDVVIQLGAILAVVVYFRGRLFDFIRTFPGGAGEGRWFRHPLSLVLLACSVTAVPAYLLNRYISQNLESLLIIGTSVLVGGVVMWVVDGFLGEGQPAPLAAGESPLEGDHSRPRTQRIEDMSPLQAAWIGGVQILSAVFPGASRSMSTIAAGQVAGLTRAAALEFSFFVSIPVMLAACGYKLLEAIGANLVPAEYLGGRSTQWGVLATGFVVSFFVAWAVIAWFMAWVRHHGFVPFAIYRILLGSAVVLWAL